MFDANDYIIEVNKLSEGSNAFEMKADKALFDNFQYPDISDAAADISIKVVKNDKLIELGFVFKGELKVVCSRCLNTLSIPVDKQTALYVKIDDVDKKSSTDGILEIDVDQWLLDENETKMDLSHYIYEELVTLIPIAPVHLHAEDCDKVMLEKLDAVNKTENKETDPRWDKLKELL
ncbi:MAG: DUF177 domain-containing protein [Bacteroidales bacterium]|nr:DUF177 domain-containing protein [Bacteroidales bacterium]